VIIQPFIFNWKNQIQKVLDTEVAIQRIFSNLIVINSDEDNNKQHWINLGDDAYFSDQFLTAIDLFDGDILFHIQGDAVYHNWEGVVASAIENFEKYNWGVYAPNINYTYHDVDKVNIKWDLTKNTNISLVSCTDCTCWFIHKDIIDLIKEKKIDLAKSKYGWGIDMLTCAISYNAGRPVLRDYDHTINHPKGTGYNEDAARKQMYDLYSSIDIDLVTIISHIYRDRSVLVQYLR
jgi:hypothetical protein